MLALYGHPFSSYTWKAQIALHALALDYELRVIDAEFPENHAFIKARGGPQGLFPVLADGERVVFEATAIIEYLAARHPAGALIPADPLAAVDVRMLDRVFDNYVMSRVQSAVSAVMHNPGDAEPAALVEARERLRGSYAWLERWLAARAPAGDAVTLVECAAAPSLFYADWVERIAPATWPLLAAWRARLNALPPVSRCIEAARPYRAYFPLGAPDRD